MECVNSQTAIPIAIPITRSGSFKGLHAKVLGLRVAGIQGSIAGGIRA